MPRKKTLCDLLESDAREKKPRKKIPLEDRVRIWGKSWSNNRRKHYLQQKRARKEALLLTKQSVSKDV